MIQLEHERLYGDEIGSDGTESITRELSSDVCWVILMSPSIDRVLIESFWIKSFWIEYSIDRVLKSLSGDLTRVTYGVKSCVYKVVSVSRVHQDSVYCFVFVVNIVLSSSLTLNT